MKNYEVLIIGGGMAGMSAALILGRALVNCCIITKEHIGVSKDYRPHNFITNDGKSMSEIIVDAESDLEKYDSIEQINAAVHQVSNVDGQYIVDLENGERISSNRVVFATGSAYDFSNGIPGLEDIFGITAFNCPFCHGYEMQDKRVVVMGDVNQAIPLAKTLARWTKNVQVILEGEEPGQLASDSFKMFNSPVEYIHSDDGMLKYIELKDGERVTADCLFLSNMNSYITDSLPSQLGLELAMNPMVNAPVYPTDPVGRTQLKNAYVIGDIRTGFSTMVGAANEGNIVGMVIVGEITQES